MFCRKCGTKNADDARFCSHCGAPMNTVQPGTMPGMNGRPVGPAGQRPGGTMPMGPQKKKSGHRRVWIIAIVAVIIVAVIASAIFIRGKIVGRSYEKTIDQMAEAINDADLGELMDLIPEDVIVYALEQEGYTGSKKEILDKATALLEDKWDGSLGSKLLGAAVDVTYEIEDTEDIKGDGLDYIKEVYKEADVKVSAAKNVEVQFTVKALGLSKDTTQQIPLIKVGRSWYLDVISMGDLF